ncbi:hypothetical protein BDZ91DRAFT_693643 [Kalaharituber pfeilii]|nr:hypothetical protein BDZ91DRAFT_693643 [Kalaharituber pfeilii]
MTKPTTHYPPTSLHVVIVGAGFGGLTAAIECHFKGHKVTVLERSPKWRQLGDILSLGPNAGQILSRYSPEHIAAKMEPICMNNDRFRIHTLKGELLIEQVVPPVEGKPMYNGHRAELHRVLYDYAVALGIPVRMGSKVVSYEEDAEQAWVVLESGEVVKGNIVVAADGLRSKAKKVVLESHGIDAGSGERGVTGTWKERSTGYAVYRAWYDAEKCGIGKDPLTAFLMKRDTHVGWLGRDVHFLAASLKGGKEISWVATHPTTIQDLDTEDDGEDWMNPIPAKVEEAVKLFEGWDPVCAAIVSKTPSLIDFPLMTRLPLPTFISRIGHICLLGDSAHPFLPTSIQGASQAMEDGVVLATCLSLSYFSPHHKNFSAGQRCTIAVQAYQKMRYERVKAAQKTGEEVMKNWHKTEEREWEAAKEQPKSVQLPRDEWLLGHDAETWCHDVWEEVLEELSGGKPVRRERLAAGPESTEVKGVNYG